MNKNQYKRYKEIGSEIAQLHQDMEDTLTEIKQHYIDRNLKSVRGAQIRLENIIRGIDMREVIREELLLPQYVKMEGAMRYVKDQPKSFVEEFIAMYLTDNYNHNVYECTYHSDAKNIYITNIRWNKNQVLPRDVKRVLKGELDHIKNGHFEMYKYGMKEGMVLIKHKASNYVNAYTYKKAIKVMEEHYYL